MNTVFSVFALGIILVVCLPLIGTSLTGEESFGFWFLGGLLLWLVPLIAKLAVKLFERKEVSK